MTFLKKEIASLTLAMTGVMTKAGIAEAKAEPEAARPNPVKYSNNFTREGTPKKY